MIPKILLAYCAGVIDSDGYIGVKRSTYAMRVTKDCEQATYSERVCVKQVEPEAIDLLHGLFGGHRGIGKPTAAKGRPLFSWQVTDQRAATFLKAILPYLRIKKRQAQNCLELRKMKEESKRVRVAFGRGHTGSARRPVHLTESMQQAYLRGKELNAVGTGERGLP